VSYTHGADSEAGRLRTVLVHRPGPELKRISPRNRGRILFDRLLWVTRAQQEHDAFTQILRDHGVEVLYVTELLQDALEYAPAREAAVGSALDDRGLGDDLRAAVRDHLEGLDSETLAQALIAGVTPGELGAGRGVVYALLDRHDFVIDPLPNLMFTRDSSVWIGDRVAVSSLGARSREARLLAVLYAHHPRFAGTKMLYGPHLKPIAGGDIVLLAPGVIAVGVSEHTSPAGVERLARQAFPAGLAHTVLAVPIHRTGAPHLDTICTVVDAGIVVMHPALAYTLTVHAITPRGDGLRVSRPQPFMAAAAQAMGIDRVTVIDTGLDPLTSPRGRWDGRRWDGAQWEDGGNALSLGRRLAVCDERNLETNARLTAAGVQVIPIPASELGSGRGGPRGMSCAVARDPASEPARAAAPGTPAGQATRPDLAPFPRSVPAVSNPRGLDVQAPGGQETQAQRLVQAWLARLRRTAAGPPPRPGC
jgi:arginine deiminase